jgi:hypothetical protein
VDKEKLYTDGLSLSPMSKDKEVVYDFSALNLLTNVKLNPTLSNIKNDFTIQGKTKGLVDNKG